MPIIHEAQVCPKHKVNGEREHTTVISSCQWLVEAGGSKVRGYFGLCSLRLTCEQETLSKTLIVVMNLGFIGSVLENHYKILSRGVKCLIFGVYYLIIKHGSEGNAVRGATGDIKAELREE